jgi:tetratricopeptide (TPR) repeat protein
MKNSILIFFALVSNISTIQGQDLHTPSDIQDIIKKSLLYYEQKEDTNFVVTPPINTMPNDYYFYRNENRELELLQYKMEENKILYAEYQKAIKYYETGKYKKERKILLELYENNPSNAIIITQLGNSFFNEQEYIEAKSWANKAIRVNSIHSPAYVLLAKTLTVAGLHEEAMEAITKAHIYNRNDRQTLLLLKEIYLKNSRIYDDTWLFIPQCQIIKESENKIAIKYNGEPWRAFAACNAVWEHEPYYKQKMEITGNDLEQIRYHEALMNLGIAFENWENKKRKKKFYMGNAVKTAVEKNLVHEFLDYELKYLEDPKAALFLNFDQVRALSKYIIEVRALQQNSRKEIIEDHTKLIDGK